MKLPDLAKQFAEDVVIFICGAASLAVFQIVMRSFPMSDSFRDALEDLHFRCVYALVLTVAAATIIRVVRHFLRNPE